MKYLTADFGSTFTKLTAIDTRLGRVVGTSTAFTTIETNVLTGFYNALAKLENEIGTFAYDKLLCCSSAAGGLKMVALGLVPELTAKASRMAATSAGAKVVKTYSFEISQEEQDEIYQINPDLVLLCGGTDGGNKEVIIANAKRLCTIGRNFAIIAAGNKSASDELKAIFAGSDKNWAITQNVMPEFNKINIEPAKQKIKELFINRIVDAKGLSQVRAMSEYEIIPTPLAVFHGCELLSKGTKTQSGIGDLMAVDIGGATTDVYSMAAGTPTLENVMIKGLPEPFGKRTVEGDLGMRYSLSSLIDQLDLESLADEYSIPQEKISNWIEKCTKNPDTLSENDSEEELIEEILAKNAIRIAVERHCGNLETAYTPFGEMFVLTGKNLSQIPNVIGIGGAIINSRHPDFILSGAAKTNTSDKMIAKPISPNYLIDKRYIFASMGLLSLIDPDMALTIIKNETTHIPNK